MKKLPNDLSAVNSRIDWLLENRFAGNKSALAKAVGLSPTAITDVVNGKKPPGRKMLAAIVQQLRVNATWLLTGRGKPDDEPPPPKGIPVADKVLPGPLFEHRDQLTAQNIDLGKIATRTQYWLRLPSDARIVATGQRGFLAGDHLLVETDPARFPAVDGLFNSICVVMVSENDTRSYRLGIIEAIGDDQQILYVDCFDGEVSRKEMVTDYIVRELPDGKLQALKKKYRLGKEAKHPVLARADQYDNRLLAHRVRVADLVAVWSGVLIRQRGS